MAPAMAYGVLLLRSNLGVSCGALGEDRAQTEAAIAAARASPQTLAGYHAIAEASSKRFVNLEPRNLLWFARFAVTLQFVIQLLTSERVATLRDVYYSLVAQKPLFESQVRVVEA